MKITTGAWVIRQRPLPDQFKVSREDQDEFALQFPYERHLKALEENRFQDQIVPIDVEANLYRCQRKKSDKS